FLTLRDHDDGDVRVRFAKLVKGLEPALAGDLLIEQNQVERTASNEGNGVFGVGGRFDLEAFVSQEHAMRFEELRLVVHPEYGFRRLRHGGNIQHEAARPSRSFPTSGPSSTRADFCRAPRLPSVRARTDELPLPRPRVTRGPRATRRASRGGARGLRRRAPGARHARRAWSVHGDEGRPRRACSNVAPDPGPSSGGASPPPNLHTCPRRVSA